MAAKTSGWYAKVAAIVVGVAAVTGGLAAFIGNVGTIRQGVTNLIGDPPLADPWLRDVDAGPLPLTEWLKVVGIVDNRNGGEVKNCAINFSATIRGVRVPLENIIFEGPTREARRLSDAFDKVSGFDKVKGNEDYQTFDIKAGSRTVRVQSVFWKPNNVAQLGKQTYPAKVSLVCGESGNRLYSNTVETELVFDWR